MHVIVIHMVIRQVQRKFSLVFIIAACLVLTFLIVSFHTEVVRADASNDQPVRMASVVESYTRYKWWLIRWEDNLILCTVYANQAGLPSGDDIYTSCGKTIYEIWATTPSCSQEAVDCPGVYLHLVSQEPAERTVLVELPPMVVNVTLGNCPFPTTENLCDRLPSLIFTAEEPIPEERIIKIDGFLDGKPFACIGDSCEVPLGVTPLFGIMVDFWSTSSFGDTSKTFQAQVRVVESGITADPTTRGWYVDVLSSQWQGKPAPTCAQIWDTFPPVGEPQNWLSTPPIPEFLATENPYYYLAGRLIAQGVVDASTCPSGGLQANGYANECGLEAAQPVVNIWQNQFDAQILEVANQVNIPAQTLKNIFAQESQFWPGAFKDPKEFGLGQITDNGAETILLWDTRFFFQYCPTVLDASTCQRGYVYLSTDYQELLRGSLATQVRSDCLDCDSGVDLELVKHSMDLFAHTLVANCAQVSRLVFNATQRSPSFVSDYENLWRFTVANYHVGPGCLSYALHNTSARNEPLDWAHVQKYLTPVCQSAIEYVDKITK
jgi:hypothetical protein